MLIGSRLMSKLISWNISSRVNARSEQLKGIASEQADVLALQEVARASDLQRGLSALGFKHFASTEPTDDRNKLVAIASREPFRVISPFAVPHPERAISCLILLQGEEVELHCVHVPPGSTYGGTKIEFLEAIISGLSTRERPQLLVGDFNCPQFMEPKVITWAQRLGKGGWQVQKTCEGVDGSRWDAAERSILCPRADMKDAFKFLNGVAIDTYSAKAKGGPNCFDHVIASVSIMPSTIRVADSVIPKLSDHAALVAEWQVAGGR
jgi:endonuclease/exonuclease/phosphatase family metal-dependent hydrolase